MDYDSDRALEATDKALEAGIPPLRIIEDGITKAMRIVGKQFEDGELFLMHLVGAAEASKQAMKILEPRMAGLETERKSLGKVVIGTVAGDIHDIGKSIVSSMLFAAGFEVYDLGKDVPVDQFVRRTKEVKADIVASSALLTMTMPMQHEIVKSLVAEGMRDEVKIMVGGAPVTKEWMQEIGADGWGQSAIEAVKVAKQVLGIP